jgi:predicted nucleotidyltransferase
MNHGLSGATVASINGVFALHPAVEKAVLFGSRAMGTFSNGSDIDLALFGGQLDHRELMQLADELDELLLPYTIDLMDFARIDHAGLREHIQRVGRIVYQRPEPVRG